MLAHTHTYILSHFWKTVEERIFFKDWGCYGEAELSGGNAMLLRVRVMQLLKH